MKIFVLGSRFFVMTPFMFLPPLLARSILTVATKINTGNETLYYDCPSSTFQHGIMSSLVNYDVRLSLRGNPDKL